MDAMSYCYHLRAPGDEDHMGRYHALSSRLSQPRGVYFSQEIKNKDGNIFIGQAVSPNVLIYPVKRLSAA